MDGIQIINKKHSEWHNNKYINNAQI